ncbi:hypothetical protein [Massilia niabensis]|uniref:Uncharacterized protein n=1 Tax=Massilia niabensis TaxID=544910 RepID=A0ABW0LCN7_9BURK
MKNIFLHLFVAMMAALISSLVPREVVALIPGSEDCVQGCTFVAGGWPVAYLVDHHGISPVGSVSLIMGFVGADHIRTPEFLLTFMFWLMVSVVLWNGLKRLQLHK